MVAVLNVSEDHETASILLLVINICITLYQITYSHVFIILSVFYWASLPVLNCC